MSFSALPNELLVQALSQDILSLYDYNSISRVDKFLNRFITPLLYENAVLDISLKPKFPITNERKLDSFRLSIQQNLNIRPLVQSLSLNFYAVASCYSHPGVIELRKRLEYLLQSLPLLRILKLSFCTPDGCIDTIPWKTDSNPLDQDFPFHLLEKLQEIHYEGFQPTAEDISNLMRLPKIQKLTIGNIVPTSVPPATLTSQQWPWAEKTSSLRHLHLGSGVLPNNEIKALARMSRCLESLKHICTIDTLQMGRQRPFRLPPPLSDFFSPLTENVTELCFKGSWALHSMNNVLLDLSTFRALKTLEIPQRFLFPTGMRRPYQHGHVLTTEYAAQVSPRDGMYKKLPRTLENLTIFFDSASKIMGPLLEASAGAFPPVFRVVENYHWIEELANYKLTNFPALHKVCLVQFHEDSKSRDDISRKSWRTGSEWYLVTASIRLSLSNELRRNGIKLNAWDGIQMAGHKTLIVD